MKLMIASDIHGSAKWCRQMLEAFDRERPEKLLLLGDILYHGPRNDLPPEYEPREVSAMLNQRKEKLLCVRGNCDSEVDQMVLQFPIMAEYAYLYIDGVTLYAAHGHHQNPAQPPFLNAGDILLNGHTHIPKNETYSDFIYMNPGSVSIPKEGSAHSYMLYDQRRFYWKTLEGKVYMEHCLS